MNAVRMQDLYHELHALDRFRTDLKRRQREEESAGAGGRGGAFQVTCLIYNILLSACFVRSFVS